MTSITYTRPHESWLYLVVVLDLCSHQLIAWSMRSLIDSELAINPLLIAIWRRNPNSPVIVHSDQGGQYSSHNWQAFLKAHGLVASMSWCVNCHDNAVAESLFQLLKRERVRRKPISIERKLTVMFSITSRCSTTPRIVTLMQKTSTDGVRESVFEPATKCLVKLGRFNPEV